MVRRVTTVIGASVFALGIFQTAVWAGESDQGRASYLRYCASCHGVEGKGDGTVSRSLKVKPIDLTQLKSKNKGVFPLEKVMASIEGTTRIDVHGESKMPVWGEIFEKKVSGQKDPASASATKVKMIADYLATIQR